MPQNWRMAFYLQARSDFNVIVHLNNMQHVEHCHRIHYLQMTTEKMAKAFLATSNQQPKPRHEAFIEFLRTEKLTQRIRPLVKIRASSQYRAYIDSLLSIAERIEQLAPKGRSHQPNPEYPWQSRIPDPHNVNRYINSICVPAEYSFPELNMKDIKFIKLLEFIQACMNYLEKTL